MYERVAGMNDYEAAMNLFASVLKDVDLKDAQQELIRDVATNHPEKAQALAGLLLAVRLQGTRDAVEAKA